MADQSDGPYAAHVTRHASLQSYLTIRWLADPAYRDDAFALYAWFRWLDDEIDERLDGAPARIALVARQRALLASAIGTAIEVPVGSATRPAIVTAGGSVAGVTGAPPTTEESLLIDLVLRDAARVGHGAPGPSPCLLLALESMLDVMAVDAERRGRALTAGRLDAYTHSLAVGVTESLHHCIGHGCASPQDRTRYVAVTGAHVAHMLRDLAEDVVAGYLNLPAELSTDLPDVASPDDPDLLAALQTPDMREWVRGRAHEARRCFATGRHYLARVDNARCRLAGHAYISRFEWVLDAIERDGYRLRPGYPERTSLRGGLSVAGRTVRSALAATVRQTDPGPARARAVGR